MSEIKTTINLPSSFPSSVKISESEMPDFIKRTLAIELYREGKLSLGKAAELAGARNKWEMLTLLDKSGVPLNYTIEDIEKDLDTLERITG
jgi:predicted HTH domain antitoxin